VLLLVPLLLLTCVLLLVPLLLLTCLLLLVPLLLLTCLLLVLLLLLQGGFLQTTRWSALYHALHLAVFWQNHLVGTAIARNLLCVAAVQGVASFALDYCHRSAFLRASLAGKEAKRD
jgi:hypothetical protein